MKTRANAALTAVLYLTLTAPGICAVVTDRGPDSSVWKETIREILPGGGERTRERSYVELATGLNYQKNGEWLESREEIEIVKNGAVGRQTPHKVFFAANLNCQGAIEITSSGGQKFRSTPRWLGFHDSATGQDVFVAELKDSVAELVAPNVLVYRDCFSGCRADLRCTYSRGGYESDVVLYDDGFGTPEDYGLNSKTTRLEAWHEFFESANPTKHSQQLSDGAEDETLDFGDLRIGRGQAFAVDRSGATVEVSKTWISEAGRTFLIEGVGYEGLRPLLEKLKRQAQVKGPSEQVKRLATVVTGRGTLVAKTAALTRTAKDLGLMASIKQGQPITEPGVVIDYTAVSVNKTNFTFQGDTTYLISGAIGFYSNTTFEAGTVIKYGPSNIARITVSGPMTWQATAYRPIVLTARDDHSVGEKIGSAALDTNYYAETALYIDAGAAGASATLQNFRVTYASNAVTLNGYSGHVLSHAQIVNCKTGVRAAGTEFTLRNALFHKVVNSFDGSSSTGRCEQLTVDNGTSLNPNTNVVLFLTNSLLVALTDFGSYSGASVSNVASAAGVFQTVGSGSHYLANGSPFRDMGTSNIAPTLATQIKKMTTYPPIVLTNGITTNTTFSPQALRDTDTWDLGFHYDALDYMVDGVALTNATALLTNGVAFSTLNGSSYYGMYIGTGGKLLSVGSPVTRNVLTRYSSVQEQPSSSGNFGSIVGNDSAGTNQLLVSRFTDWCGSSSAGDFATLYNYNMTSSPALSHSQFFVGKFFVKGGPFAATNCLWERSTLLLNDDEATVNQYVFNNLFWRGAVNLTRGGGGILMVKDTFFDGSTNTQTGTVTNAYNGYVNGAARLTPTNTLTTDQLLSNFTYARGSLGNYYQVSTNLQNAGSRNATNAGLYHFTTTTNEVKETSTVVDIGYHYISITNSVPTDYDSDGLADYLEDANGNGSVDAGETSWLSP